MSIDELLDKTFELEGSDLFIAPGRPASVKVHGQIQPIQDKILTPEKARKTILSLMDEQQQKEFLARKELNFAIQTATAGRFRVSAYFEKFQVAAVLRRIKATIPKLEDLDLPVAINGLSMVKRGLILFVGATGVGKSTTMASIVSYRNHNSSGHIVTIEDPIEFIHEHAQCIVTQREVGVDTESYGIALRNALRQAPDVVMIGEIRSAETMEYALQFSETGHLCLATIHANNANQALDRIINFFPSTKHQQIWLELSLNLRAIVAQQLIPRTDKEGRAAAVELVINTPIIQSCIKKGEVDVLKEYMARGGNVGMQTFDQSLFDLYKQNKISYEDALKYADSENEIRLMIKLDEGSNYDPGSLTNVGLKD